MMLNLSTTTNPTDKLEDLVEHDPINIHPGEILDEEFLDPLGLSRYRLAKESNISESQISRIVNGKAGITADTALRLGKYFGTGAKFWLNLQTQFELRQASKTVDLSTTGVFHTHVA